MRSLVIAGLTAIFATSGVHSESSDKLGIGRTATEAEIAGWNIDVDRNGTNLPPGKGTVGLGREVFDQQCAACHGAKGEGGVGDKLVGGQGTLATSKPVKTVGSYWPYATTLFDYIRRAMPHPSPQSLSNEEVYAVTAYVLHLNGLLPENASLDSKTLPSVRMPNRDNFVGDPRPDLK
ncbi:c-type cytochrome [Bradyrhizobium liaoningense]|uniref:c-type cytochrome n=1 Tax=Bradyrhizobium liaoningense TaxID=43992 RepID=UPI001BAC25F7|nr:cytochrome c [Bradyrhizobium liaoningense]MBR0859201.1 cytochrome c [Bradyrhizobium liaoningense]